MAAPAVRNIEVTQGDTHLHTVTITSDGTTAINITGRTYAAKVRNSADTVILTLTCTVPTGTDGQVVIGATATATGAVSPGVYRWELEETSGASVSTVLAGSFTILKQVTY